MFRILLALATVSLALASDPDKVVPAINDIESWQQVGQQPYEMTWAERAENPHTLVDFEDLSGWKLELYRGAAGEFRRSREQQMWGHSVGKFVFSGPSTESRVVARPPQPIPIPGEFDSVELWGYGNRWGWEEDKTTPAADVAVLLMDARGKEFRIPLTDIRWKQWWLIHRRVSAAMLKEMSAPVAISGIEISKIGNTEPRYFFCDSLAIYREEFQPLHFAAQPKRNLRPWRGQIAGLNTGTGRLPFPTREETILPRNQERQFKTSVVQSGPQKFELRYAGRDATIVYEYRPAAGKLGEITASVNGGPAFRPLEGGGVRFEDTAQASVAEGSLMTAKLDGDVVRATFKYGTRQVEYELRLWQKSLVLDARAEGGEVTELSFGRVAGVTRPKLITVPYITYGGTNPRVLMSGPAAKPMFTSVWWDWYRTNASAPYASKQPQVSEDGAPVNGGLRYTPKTDGRRNPMYERIFVTTSPVYEETLPTIPNPASLRQAEGKAVVWTVAGDIETFQKDHARSRAIRAYGLDHIMQHSHEITWRDEGDSFTLRLRPSPQKGGEAGLKWYMAAQLGLGWLQGVYSNYTDIGTTNTNFSGDAVQREPNGEWRRAWMRCYAIKPSKAVEFDEYYAQRIEKMYGVKMSYTDVHTANPQWEYNDFDARVPGAGTMAATFYAYGQLLLNDQRVYGPTQSEGTYQWMYAGLESGSYGWVYTDMNLLTHPLDVAFHLNEIHPLQCDYGMGDTSFSLSKMEPGWMKSPKRREYVDLFMATTIGYGNMGWLVSEFPDEPFHAEAMARSYYMLQQLQQQYAFVRPARIEYADQDGKMLTPSAAQATGAIAGSRLHVVYENGTEVYVNRGDGGAWTVKDGRGQAVELPAAGWLAFNPRNGLYEVSANVGGHRLDYVTAPEYEFLDGRGQWTQRGNVGATGSVALRHDGRALELIDVYGNDRIAFRAEHAGALTARDADGKTLGPVAVKASAGWYEFRPTAGARSYRFE
ncbi:MAG: hypothetical protein ABSE21_00925 [Bryobacteraceae bacterium]|jgi:hypothetical protein